MKKSFWIILIAIITPLIVHTLISVPSPFRNGSAEAWIGFYGSYFGGIIGGLVAYMIARYQINYQKINEAKTRSYNQLPYLVKLKFILEDMKISLRYASDFVNEKIPKVEGEEFKFNHNIPYEPDCQISKDVYSITDKILNTDLQVKIIELFDFFIKFSDAVGFDQSENLQEFKDIEHQLSKLASTRNKEHEKNSLEFKKTKLHQKLNFSSIKKKIMWEELKNKDYYRFCEELYSNVEKEIEKLKSMKA